MGRKNNKKSQNKASQDQSQKPADSPAEAVEAKESAAPLENGSSQHAGPTASSPEAEQVKFMITNMPKKVDVGSEWFIVSMAWISKWQKFVGFEDDQAPNGINPGKIDNSDIIEAHPESQAGCSTPLPETAQNRACENFQIKKGLCEGTDFMLVDKNIYCYWSAKYGKESNELLRKGIIDESGEDKVEMFLKQVNLYAIPNKLFKIDKGADAKKGKVSSSEYYCPIFCSKMDTLDTLRKKILRLLNGHLYFVIKEKSIMVKEIKLWKSNYEDKGDLTKLLRSIDKKYTNFTQAEIKADLLNNGPDDLHKKLHDVNLADTDMLIIETPKNNEAGVFVFKKEGDDEQSDSDEEEEQKGYDGPNQRKSGSSGSYNDINQLDLEQVFKKSSRRGRVGLQNMGNTCFMNSALQCLSNTSELTKFFLFNLYQSDLNTDSPLGLGGNLAKAYHALMHDLWIGKEARTAPYDLKRVLGKRLQQFSGYGQQCSGEFLTCLLDYLHEDLNRIKKKPYIEIPDQGDRSDQEMSDLSWNAFLARNQSIIVDLMYGQLKSTVKCNECGKISITYDPFLTLPLPISKPNIFQVAFIPFELYRKRVVVLDNGKEDQSSSEDDPDFKDDRKNIVQNEHLLFSIPVTADTTVLDCKNQIIEKASKIGERTIYAENLTFAKCKYGEIYAEWGDKDLVDDIDTSQMGKTYAQELHIFIEVRAEKSLADKKDRACTELDFKKLCVNARGTSSLQIQKAIPRYHDFMKSDSILEMKTQIYERIKDIYSPQQQAKADEEWIHKAINLNIKDNTPYVRSRYGQQEKAKCEFCGKQHVGGRDYCDVRTEEHGSASELEAAKAIKLGDLYDMLNADREIIFEVQLNQEDNYECDLKGFTLNLRNSETEKTGSDVQQLDSLFRQFTTEEILSGNDQYYCSKCKEHRDAKKTLQLFKTPKIMVIHLKRFKSKKQAANSGKSGFFNLAYAQICQQEKIDEQVQFPTEGLDIKEHLQMDCEANGISTVYDLYALVNHFGNLNGGHYTAYARNPDGNWYDYNDSQVSGASINNLCSSAAYVLFYRRRDSTVPSSPGAASEQNQSTEAQTSENRESEKSGDSAAYIDELD